MNDLILSGIKTMFYLGLLYLLTVGIFIYTNKVPNDLLTYAIIGCLLTISGLVAIKFDDWNF